MVYASNTSQTQRKFNIFKKGGRKMEFWHVLHSALRCILVAKMEKIVLPYIIRR